MDNDNYEVELITCGNVEWKLHSVNAQWKLHIQIDM
jgi:hypothetical protein